MHTTNQEIMVSANAPPYIWKNIKGHALVQRR